MPPKLYGTIISPPVRAVMLCAKGIDLEVDLVEVDLMKGEHLDPKFLKINPLHTVPLLDDDGFLLTDSHAIMAYLVESYAQDKSLYPSNVRQRAKINQMLHFDSGTLFPRHLKNSLSVLLEGSIVVPPENIKSVVECYGFVETFLANRTYIAGDYLSIADFSVITTITNAEAFAPLNEDDYPNMKGWKKTLEKLPYFNISKQGSEKYHCLIDSVLSHK